MKKDKRILQQFQLPSSENPNFRSSPLQHYSSLFLSQLFRLHNFPRCTLQGSLGVTNNLVTYFPTKSYWKRQRPLSLGSVTRLPSYFRFRNIPSGDRSLSPALVKGQGSRLSVGGPAIGPVPFAAWHTMHSL